MFPQETHHNEGRSGQIMMRCCLPVAATVFLCSEAAMLLEPSYSFYRDLLSCFWLTNYVSVYESPVTVTLVAGFVCPVHFFAPLWLSPDYHRSPKWIS